MIRPRQHRFLSSFYRLCSRGMIRRSFKEVYLNGPFADTERSLLVISNHFTSRNPLFIDWLNHYCLHKKFHMHFSEEDYMKRWNFLFGRKFPSGERGKSSDESLNQSINILKDPDNMLLYFPQEKIESIYTRSYCFEKEFELLVNKMGNDCCTLFTAIQIEYFDSLKPSLFMHYKFYNHMGKEIDEIERDYNTFFVDSSKENFSIYKR